MFLNQSTEFCNHFEDSYWYCYIVLVLFAFTVPVGLLGNLVVLINHTCFRKTSSSSNIFLLNLTLCDSGWILTLPFSLYITLRRPHITNIQIFCQFKKSFFNINIYGSILFLTLISFDRFVGTVHPISSLRWWNAGKAKLCSFCVWVLVVLSSIPDLFLTFSIQPTENVTMCVDQIQDPFYYVRTAIIIRTTIGFLLPFTVMLAFYTMTVRVLRRLPRGQSNRARGKPLHLLTAAILVFVVSFLPYHTMATTMVFMRISNLVTPSNTNVLYACYEFSEAMCSVSSCLDPVLYILAGEQFQRKFLAWKRGQYRRFCCRASRRIGVIE